MKMMVQGDPEMQAYASQPGPSIPTIHLTEEPAIGTYRRNERQSEISRRLGGGLAYEWEGPT